MEAFVRQTLLYDFYGELLTSHQQKIYEDVVLNDISCSEIAEENGVSRQGVNDLIHRCNRQLEGYEEKLHLVERFLRVRTEVEALRALAQCEEGNPVSAEEVLTRCDRILKEL